MSKQFKRECHKLRQVAAIKKQSETRAKKIAGRLDHTFMMSEEKNIE